MQRLLWNAAVCHFLGLIVLRLRWLWHMTQRFSSDVLSEDRMTALNGNDHGASARPQIYCLYIYIYIYRYKNMQLIIYSNGDGMKWNKTPCFPSQPQRMYAVLCSTSKCLKAWRWALGGNTFQNYSIRNKKWKKNLERHTLEISKVIPNQFRMNWLCLICNVYSFLISVSFFILLTQWY